jgi:hypothetical protein
MLYSTSSRHYRPSIIPSPHLFLSYQFPQDEISSSSLHSPIQALQPKTLMCPKSELHLPAQTVPKAQYWFRELPPSPFLSRRTIRGMWIQRKGNYLGHPRFMRLVPGIIDRPQWTRGQHPRGRQVLSLSKLNIDVTFPSTRRQLPNPNLPPLNHPRDPGIYYSRRRL